MSAEHQNLIAYLRVSSEAQDTQLQRDALTEAGCGKFFEDKISSRKTDRPGLAAAMDYLRSRRHPGRPKTRPARPLCPRRPRDRRRPRVTRDQALPRRTGL